MKIGKVTYFYFIKIHTCDLNKHKYSMELAPAGIFSGGIEVHKRRAYEGSRRVGGQGVKPPGCRRSFQIFLKSNENFAIFRQKCSMFG